MLFDYIPEVEEKLNRHWWYRNCTRICWVLIACYVAVVVLLFLKHGI